MRAFVLISIVLFGLIFCGGCDNLDEYPFKGVVPLPSSASAPVDDYSLNVTASDREYFSRLQRAILGDDVAWVSQELCCYPFSVRLPKGRTIKIKNEELLKGKFDTIFSPEMKKIVRDQSPDSLFKNWQGLMIGNGEIWFGEIGVTNGDKMVWEYKILSIDLDALTLPGRVATVGVDLVAPNPQEHQTHLPEPALVTVLCAGQ